MTKITVLMNCLNGEAFVRDAIDSVYAQTFADWEIVFWDNASTDSTAQIALSYDSRLRYFRSAETVPLGQARQWALAEARGEWLTILDHDDAFLPQRFERQIAALDAGDFSMSYCGYNEMDADGKILRAVLPRYKSGPLLNELLVDYEINVATVMMRREYLARIDAAAVASFKMAEEYYYYLSLAAMGPVCVVPEILTNYRQVDSSWSERVPERLSIEILETLDLLERDRPGTAARYADGFAHARARAGYANAKYLMRQGRYGEAHKAMAAIRHMRRLYGILYVVSYVPPLWTLLHKRSVKARLTGVFLGT